MHIKRLLSGTLAALMVVTSFNMPTSRVYAAEETKEVVEATGDVDESSEDVVDDTEDVVGETATTDDADAEAPAPAETPGEELEEEQVDADEVLAEEPTLVDLSACTITIKNGEEAATTAVYKNAAYSLTVEVKNGTTPLTETTDYEGKWYKKGDANKTAATLKDAGTYVYEISAVSEKSTNSKTAEFTITPAELEATAITLGDDSAGTGETYNKAAPATESALDKYNLHYDTTAGENKGVAGKQIKPSVTVTGVGEEELTDKTSQTTDELKKGGYTVAYGANNTIGDEAGTVTITLTNDNYVFKSGANVKKFTIKDADSDTYTEDKTLRTKAVVSNTECKAGQKVSFGTNYGKKKVEVIPALDPKSITDTAYDKTEAGFDTINTANNDSGTFKVKDTSRESITSNFTITKALNAAGNGAIITFTAATGDSALYSGEYKLEYEFSPDVATRTFDKKIIPADFGTALKDDGEWYYYIKETGVKATSSDKAAIKEQFGLDEEPAAVSGTIAHLNEAVTFDIINGKEEVTFDNTDPENNTIRYRGNPVTIDGIEIEDTASDAAKKVTITKNTIKVGSADAEKHEKDIFEVAYEKNNAVGTAKVTITFTDELPEYAGAKIEKTFTIDPATYDVDAPTIKVVEDPNDLLSIYRYGYKVTLSTPTTGAKIYYKITKSSDADNTSINFDNPTEVTKLCQGQSVDGVEPYENAIVLANTQAISDVITIVAIAVKDGTAAVMSPISLNMIDAATDWGEVNPKSVMATGYDFDDTGKTATDIPQGLWISEKSLGSLVSDNSIGTSSTAIYNGYAWTMKNTDAYPVRVFYGTKLLDSSQYTIKYTNNVNAALASDAKAPTITVTGKGEYAGGYTKTFTINPRTIDDTTATYGYDDFRISTATLVLPEKNTIQKPKFTIEAYDYSKSDKAKKPVYIKLSEGKDFVVDYSGVKAEAGDYTINISGNGNYTTNSTPIVRTLTISPVGRYITNAKVTFDASNVVFDGNDQIDNLKTHVKIGDVELIRGTDYVVSVYNVLSPVTNLTTASGNAYYSVYTPSYVAGLQAKLVTAGQYYVYINGIGDFAGSYSKKMTISNKTATPASKLGYDGIEKERPYGAAAMTALKVTDGGKTLTEGVDYLVGYTFTNAATAAVGNAKVTVYGIGKYTGSKTFSYKIVGQQIKDIIVEYDESVPYRNIQYYPTIATDGTTIFNGLNLVVKYQPDEKVAPTKLVYGKDYTIVELDPKKKAPNWTDAGKKAFTIKGVNGYVGTVKKTFTITPYDFDADQKNVVYDAEGKFVTANGADLVFNYQKVQNMFEPVPFTGAGVEPVITSSAPAKLYVPTNAADYAKFVKANFKFTYSKNFRNAGEDVTVTVTPTKKNIAGSAVTMTYTVEKYDVNDAVISIKDKVTGKWSDPKPEVKNAKLNKKLAVNKDFTVEYFYANKTEVTVGTGKAAKKETRAKFEKINPKTCKDIIPAGTEIVARITGIGNYTGERDFSYRYVGAKNDIGKAKVNVLGIYFYTGVDTILSKDNIQVTLNNEKVDSKNFEIVSYTYPKNGVGTAKVLIHGLNDFGGYKEASFKIEKVSMNYIVQFATADSTELTYSGTTKALTNAKGNSFVLPDSKFKAEKVVAATKTTKEKRTAYTFVGWSPNKNGSAPVYGAGETFVVDEKLAGVPVTLYAVYEAPSTKTYTIKFSAGATKGITGTLPKDIVAKRGQVVSLPGAGSLKRESYVFAGWNFTPQSGTAVTGAKAGTKVQNLASSGTVTVTANWKEAPFKITYKLNGGVNSAANPNSYEFGLAGVTGNTITLADATKVGNAFKGWTDQSGKKITAITATTTGNLTLTANFEPVTYTVDLDPQTIATGASKVVGTTKYVYGKDVVELPKDVTTTNKEITLLGWAYDSKSVKPDFKPGAKIKTIAPNVEDKKATLYAVWQQKEYTVTLVDNSGKKPVTLEKIVGRASSFPVALPTTYKKAGYTLSGWTSDGKTTVNSVATAADVTLEAVWAENKTEYTVTFSANGGTLKDGAKNEGQKFKADESKALTSNPFERKNYIFSGWAEGDGSTVQYDDGATICPNANLSLKAIWAPVSKPVHYVLDGGVISSNQGMADKYTYSAEKSVTLPVNTDSTTYIKKTGYTFGGWYEVESSDADIPTGASVITSIAAWSDTTKDIKEVYVKAKWTADPVALTFTGATLKTGSFPANYTFGSESDVDLPTEDKLNANAGYEFKGWKITTASGKVLATEATELPKNNTEALTLAAVWSALTYDIEWELGNVENVKILDSNKKAVTLPKKFKAGGDAIGIPAPVAEGATFTGWEIKKGSAAATSTGSGTGTLTIDTDLIKGADTDITFIATWTIHKKTTITFDANGGEGSMDAQVMYSDGQSYNLKASKMKTTGASFSGWNTKADGSGTAYADKASWTPSSEKDTDVTLYAQYATKWTGTVTFNPNGGDAISSGATHAISYETTDEAKATASFAMLDTVTRSHYDLAGWSTTRAGSVTYKLPNAEGKPDGGYKYYIEPKYNGQKVTLYAVWTPKVHYTFKFVGGTGATGTMSDQEIFVDDPETTKLTANAFTKAGYSFGGWTSDETPSHEYTNENAIDATGLTANKTITLTAKWTPCTNTISFVKNANEATGEAPETVVITSGVTTAAAAPANTFTNDAKVFKGWNTKADGTGTTYAAGANLNVTALQPSGSTNITTELFAMWAEQ